MEKLQSLIEKFEKFPGVGKRQARRFVFYLLTKNESYLREITEGIRKLKDNMKLCVESFQFFYTDNPKETLSPICRDERRDKSIMMIVEKDTDLENVEKLHLFPGVYFVLGGVFPVLGTDPEKFIRLNELKKIINLRIERDGLSEIILATSLTPNGENTYDLLKQEIGKIIEGKNIKLTSLGRGLSTGTELEYSDKDTFESAFLNRK